MGEKGMESGPVGPGSAATAVGGSGIERMKGDVGIGSMSDAIGGPAQMSGETLGGGGGSGMSELLKGASSTGDEELKKKP